MEEEKLLKAVRQYSDMILRLAFSYMKNAADAEDVVQDVFTKLIEKDMHFESEEHEKAWLLRVVINLCKNKLKRFSRRRYAALEEADAVARDDNADLDGTVSDAVMRLNEKQRLVIHLYYYEGYKTPELAELLHMGESSVRTVLHRARQNLKIMLEEEYDFE